MVSQITQELRARYQAFRARSLGEVRLLVLFLDAVYLPTRPSGAKEGVLVAWGYDETGRRVLLDVVLAQRERHEDWLEMGRDLLRRGLQAPMLVVTDGAPGLIRAMEELWPDSDRQLWTAHRWRNVAAMLPKNDVKLHERVEAAYWAALDEASSPADGEARLRRLVADLERQYASAAACLAENLPALCMHLAYPLRLRKRLRSTNLLERSLEEVKRRTKEIGRFPGEASCLSLCWAGAGPVHRQRSRARTDRSGASSASSDARRSDGRDAGVVDRMRSHQLRGCAVTFPAGAGRDPAHQPEP